MSRFYSIAPLGKCEKCDAPATAEIRGPYNAKYGNTCQHHAAQKIRELEAAWKDESVATMPRA